jgi:hypothetical protein
VKNISYRDAIALDANALKMRKLNFNQLLCCILALGFSLSGIRAAHAQADPFQRYIVFYNDLPITIYPAITAVESEQGAACGTSGLNRRIIVNAGMLGAGIPSLGTVTVELPKLKHCWYTAVRVYLFTVDLTKFETRIPENQRTVADHATWNPPLCTTGAASACWSGTAAAQYPVDAPAQLYEYTVISQDPATGAAFPDPNNPNGVPLADIDVSYVDELYLPVASNVDDGGATPYMGTTLPYKQFNTQTQAFLNLTNNNKPIWSEYAAYAAANWPHNLFNDLGSPQTDHVVGKDIVGDVRIIPPNVLPPLSALYDPPYTGPQQCKAVPECSNLSGDCCPTPDGTTLACCGKPLPYLTSNTTKAPSAPSLTSLFPGLGLPRLGLPRLNLPRAVGDPGVDNPSVDALVASWTNWVQSDPCANLGAIPAWPSGPTLDKQLFCSMFESTVRSVWNSFKDSPNMTNPDGTVTPGCVSFTGAAKDRCTVDSIVAFKSNDKGLLNEQVQSLLRNVPYGTFNQTRWSFDKFILFWAPYLSPFNLFPYSRLVHNPGDGVDAPGAYSFSIDDKFGNFGGRGSGILVEVGGNTHLLNQDPYDLWEQFRVSFGSGWDHATVCGRPYTIPMNLGNAAPVSFWMNGQPQSPCNIALYKDAAETQYAEFQVTEAPNTATDTYTGQTQTVTQLAYDPSSCNSNLSAVCAGSHLVFTAVPQPVPGNNDPDPGEAWVSLSDADKPLVTLVVPAVAP